MRKITNHFLRSGSLVRLMVSCSVLGLGLWIPSAIVQAAPLDRDSLSERIRPSRSVAPPIDGAGNTLLPPSADVASRPQLDARLPVSLDAINGPRERRSESVSPVAPRVAGDENWSGKFGLPGANNYVNAVAADTGGTLYVGGIFTTTGGIPASYVAKWNESGGWAALGTGVNSYVDALAVDAGGNLYAGGNFTTAGGTTVNHIAKWNGSNWSALGNGLNSAVFALAVDGSGNLYAGGWLTQICGNAACNSGNSAASYIAMWNGSGWSALGSGVDNGVDALAAYGSDLYVGGGFTTAGGASARSIAEWNGSTWSALGYGLDLDVFGLTLDGSGNLYAGGAFTLKCSNAACSSGTAANRVAEWNGSSWIGIGSASMNGDVYALKINGSGNLIVGGDFSYGGIHYVAKYNGSWSNMSSMDWDVLGLAIDGAGNLYAGGYFATAGSKNVNYVAKWNGSAWSEIGYGVNSDVKAVAVDGSGNMYAGGNLTNAGGTNVNLIAKWNGSTWSALSTGMDGSVTALAVDGSGNLYASGYFLHAGGTTVNYVAEWNGSGWLALGSGLDEAAMALAVDGSGNLYAGGLFTHAGGNSVNYVAMWNGSNWSAVGNGVNDWVYALTVGSGTLYAGGKFTQICGNSACNSGNTTVNRVAKWNSINWYGLGNGVDDAVYGLTTDGGGNVFAGGWFTHLCGNEACNSGNTAVNSIARWYLTDWHALGSGTPGSVYALTRDGSSNVYAAGVFGVLRWNGSSWSGLGSGLNGQVKALAANNASLYVGGQFTMAGGKASSNIGQWTILPSFRLYLPIIMK
jgi:trimeric autotransporter adhesin